MSRKRRRRTLVGNVSPEVLEYTAAEDLRCDQELLEYDCIGTAAHVRSLARIRLPRPVLTPAEEKRIIGELIRLMRRSRRGEFHIRISDQDVHLAVERELSARLGEAGRKVHLGRSRNDQVAVALRLYIKDRIPGILQELSTAVRSLLGAASRYRMTPMVGRTHMQRAMPSTAAVWLASFAEALLEDGEELAHIYRASDRCPLGAGAGYGVPLPIDRDYEADILGFRGPVVNVMYAVTGRGKLEARLISALGRMMLTLSGLATDLIIFAAPEFGYVVLPEELCTGSSIMPQKRNPDVLELVRARSAVVLAAGQAAHEIVRGLPSGYQRDLQEIKPLLMNSLRTAEASLRIMRMVTDGMSLDTEAMREAFDATVFAADAAADLAVEGVPFRDAYQSVKARLAQLEGTDPREAVKRRTSRGAPGNPDLKTLRERARTLEKWADMQRRRFHSAVSRLLGVSYPGLTE